MKDLFPKTLVRLTAVYVLVLAVVCIGFSSFIYGVATNEIDRTSRQQIVGFRNMFGRFVMDEKQSEELRMSEASNAREHLRGNLFLVNLLVIGGGTGLCYFLAKRSLEPLERSHKAQERFTSDASHELRTPLAAMRTEIEVSLRDQKLNLVDARQVLQSNLEEVAKLQSMTDNLLSLARNNELREFKTVNITKPIAAAIKKLSVSAKKAGVKIDSNLEQVSMYTNSEALTQVVSILVDNSIKYAGNGATCKVVMKKSTEGLLLDINDNGVGVPKDTISLIFDRFYKADVSRTSAGAASHGLGLSIAKQLVTALNGTISAEHAVKKGLAFHIVLPIV
jgi:two-component system, OmpR family, sensor histidine kinase CiaH